MVNEHSMTLTRAVADALKKLKITFLEPESKKDIEEQMDNKKKGQRTKSYSCTLETI